MLWLTENPTPILFVGIFVVAVLAALFVTTVRKEFLWGIAGVLVLMGGAMLVDWLVVTDRELIEQTIDGGVAALEANDLDRVLTFLSPSAQKTRQRAQWALGAVEFQNVNISNLEIEVNQHTSPPTADVRFHGVFRYRETVSPDQFQGLYSARFEVEFEKIDGRWLITDHYEYEATPL